MSADVNRRKWRNFLIYPRIQLSLALINVGFVLLIVVVLIVTLLAPLFYAMGGPQDLKVRYAIAELLLRILDRFGISMLLVLVISALCYIVFSHRLCGPLINIKHTLDSVARGDLTRKVSLRRRDLLKEEAASINAMLLSLESRIGLLKANQLSLSPMIEELAEGDLKNEFRRLYRQNQVFLDQWVMDPGAGTKEVPSADLNEVGRYSIKGPL
jgi:HAMP domain-containing protein